MKKLSHAEISEKRAKIGQINEAERVPLVAVVDNVRSLYNVGSIFRTSDGALIRKLVLTGFTPYPPRKEIEKTALGATQSVPWAYVHNPLEAVRQLKSEGFTVACLEQTDKSLPYTAIQPTHFPLCLIVGNELTGVSSKLLEVCDLAFDIPQHGIKQSLNVAVAFGVAVFECARVWRGMAP